ncbi:replication-relaxation family protein [Leisingera sp. ANG59]|uniref:replication-relaxation family protein n=1 Tax=Leisingera sp. ANG59 TaxID=2675221 RepID=UPI001573509C|nr:replication-relaxation family protein [Leisingera sp. ANG59]NSY37529.1 hypothetical protein [Leisingera sp. ANG59]
MENSPQDPKTSDALGRATFHHIPAQANVRPTVRELRWFKHIERHGPQSSVSLHELTRDTHRCKDTSLRQLQKLRAAGFLRLPPQQRATERAEFNPYIYDLTRKAEVHLADLGIAEPTMRPTGHWWHGYNVACATSTIDMASARQGIRYIPAHEILAIKNTPLAIPVGQSKLIPDQLFALNYGGTYRAFALEADRGTEPITSAFARKSYSRSITQYAEAIDRGLHKTHYGLRANLLALWVFNSHSNEQRFLELLTRCSDVVQRTVLTKSVDLQALGHHPDTSLFAADWRRAAGGPCSIAA